MFTPEAPEAPEAREPHEAPARVLTPEAPEAREAREALCKQLSKAHSIKFRTSRTWPSRIHEPVAKAREQVAKLFLQNTVHVHAYNVRS